MKTLACLACCLLLIGCTEAMRHSWDTTVRDVRAYDVSTLRPLVEPEEGYPLPLDSYQRNYQNYRAQGVQTAYDAPAQKKPNRFENGIYKTPPAKIESLWPF